MTLTASEFQSGGEVRDQDGRLVTTSDGSAQAAPKGYEQITGITGGTVKSLTGAAGAKYALVTAKVAGRYRDDAVDPSSTVGQPISASTVWKFDETDLTTVRFSTVDTLDVTYYG